MQNTGFVLVNLQPFREKIKKEKIRQSAIMMFFFAFLAGISLVMIDRSISIKIENQEKKNSFISKVNKDLDSQIAEIAGLKEAIVDTLAKRRVVEALQVNRSDGVIIFNDLSTKLPEGTLLKSIKRTGNNILVIGQTQSQSKVSDYMNSLKEQAMFGEPVLQEIKSVEYVTANATKKKGEEIVKINEFTLMVPVKTIIEEEANSKSKKDKKNNKN